jgi:hypothetical protein
MRQKALDGKVHLGKKKRPATDEPEEDDADSSSESPAKKRKT